MAEDKPKEGVKAESDHVNLKVAGQDGSVVQFKIKRLTPLSKLMKAYCERQVGYRCRVRVQGIAAGCLCVRKPRRLLSGVCRGPLQGLSMQQIRFQFDGQPIRETDTPAQLEMENEDTIGVFQQQTGGSGGVGAWGVGPRRPRRLA
ncbi:small ubiquitin-related modifier 3-like isoform X1 [Erinaceus europaeus]|uniref:Small ubiquitin-related modifier 3-like isoform X1 n=1 Tax=Erinaceus europaeus TaxID=9365 RepID=A0ABM3WUV7_ERIEU|nr:small ubiquitin-related modifier 3-like isoform X1 [Erinaceus europaeus]